MTDKKHTNSAAPVVIIAEGTFSQRPIAGVRHNNRGTQKPYQLSQKAYTLTTAVLYN